MTSEADMSILNIAHDTIFMSIHIHNFTLINSTIVVSALSSYCIKSNI